jgi:hypothetical protein
MSLGPWPATSLSFPSFSSECRAVRLGHSRSLTRGWTIGAQDDAIRLVDPVDSADEKGGFGARSLITLRPFWLGTRRATSSPASPRITTICRRRACNAAAGRFMVVAGPKMGWRLQRIGIFRLWQRARRSFPAIPNHAKDPFCYGSRSGPKSTTHLGGRCSGLI